MNSVLRSLRRELKDFKSYMKKIGKTETKRINAIRKVDVGNVALANSAAETRATTLAGQVTSAKDAQVVALKSETDPLRKDIGDLRQSQWTLAGGREQVVDTKADTRAKSSNWGLWVGIGATVFVSLFIGFLSFMMALITLGVMIFTRTH